MARRHHSGSSDSLRWQAATWHPSVQITEPFHPAHQRHLHKSASFSPTNGGEAQTALDAVRTRRAKQQLGGQTAGKAQAWAPGPPGAPGAPGAEEQVGGRLGERPGPPTPHLSRPPSPRRSRPSSPRRSKPSSPSRRSKPSSPRRSRSPPMSRPPSLKDLESLMPR